MPRQKSTKSDTLANLDDMGLLRLGQVLTLYPVSRTSWWEGVASGKYPRPVKLSTRTRAWKVTDIRKLLASVTTGEAVISK